MNNFRKTQFATTSFPTLTILLLAACSGGSGSSESGTRFGTTTASSQADEADSRSDSYTANADVENVEFDLSNSPRLQVRGAGTSYEIIGGDDSGLFEITKNSFIKFVGTQEELDAERAEGSEFNVTVRVRNDAGDTQNINYKLTLVDLPDTELGLNAVPAGATNIGEGEDAARDWSYQVSARADDGAPLIYRKVAPESGPDHSRFFNVNEDTGEVTLKAGANFVYDDEENNSGSGITGLNYNGEFIPASVFFVGVEVTSNPGDSDSEQKAAQTISVAVVDSNDNPPVFESDAITETIDEGVRFSKSFAVTPDVEGTQITYSIADSGDDEYFTIDSNGLVESTAAFDFEVENGKTEYQFTVIAVPSDGPSARKSFTLVITDANDQAPEITSGGSGEQLTDGDDVSNTFVVYTGSATPDLAGAIVTWSLKQNNDDDAGLFDIDATTGEVTFKASTTLFNFDVKPTYSFTVIATSNGHSSEQLVTLGVKNVHDAKPVITSDASNLSIDENTVVEDRDATAGQPATSVDGYVLYRATATGDFSGIDEELNPTITWRIKPNVGVDFDKFKIDEETGVVTFADKTTVPAFNTASDAKNYYEFTITATSTVDGDIKSVEPAEQVIRITINNVHDKAPMITTGNNVKERLTDGTEVTSSEVLYTAAGTSDYGSIVWSIEDNRHDDSNLFEIDANSGEVTFKEAHTPNHDSGKTSYTFTIIATTSSDTTDNLTDDLTITIDVTNVNDVAPVITSPFEVKFDEGEFFSAEDSNGMGGTVVYTAKATVDKDAVEWSVEDTALLKINSSGLVTFKEGRTLEYDETLGGEQSHQFTLVATSGRLVTKETITIKITNTNDNDPVITSDPADAISIVENDQISSDRVLYTATGTYDHSPIEWSVQGLNAGLFVIDKDSGELTFSKDHIADHEDLSSYEVEIVAKSGDRQVTQDVTITVENRNETNPEITSPETVADAFTESGNPVAPTVIANAINVYQAIGTYDLTPIKWSLVPKTGDDFEKFTINEGSGIVRFKQAETIDHETKSSYTFTIRAASGELTSEQTVTLHVKDANDVAPVITIDTTSDSGTDEPKISEDLTVDEKTIFQATDVVLRFKGTYDLEPITWALSGTDEDLFDASAERGSNDYLIRFKQLTTLDHNEKGYYKLTITATSGDLSTVRDVTITVTDINNVAPVIDEFDASGVTEITENSEVPSNLVIYTASATPDVDGDTIAWSIKDNGTDDNGGLFTINGQGEVTFRSAHRPVHSEDKPEYTFTIIASTGSDDDELSSEITVTVPITDTNDKDPVFESKSEAVALPEGTEVPITQIIYTAVATADVNSVALRYSLKRFDSEGDVLDDDNALFDIDAITGAVTFKTATTPDFIENDDKTIKTNYEFTVIAAAGDRTAEQKIVVAVTNLNDIAPVIGEAAVHISVDEGTTYNTTHVLYQPTATYDEEAIVWSLKRNVGDESSLQINAATGAVSFNSRTIPDFDGGKVSYTFTIVATSGTHVEEEDVTITVNDVNNQAPVFTSVPGDATQLVEGTTYDTSYAVYQAQATPDVAGDTVSWSFATEDANGTLEDDAGLFNIDETGKVTFRQVTEPDYETLAEFDEEGEVTKPAEYTFTIIATTTGDENGPLSSSQEVSIKVSDEADVPPVFTSASEMNFDEGEEVTKDQAFYRAEAISDAGPITWSLHGSDNDNHLFTIGQDGVVKFKDDTTLDHETKSSYIFTVRAVTGEVEADLTVTINVTDLNDVTPSITSAATGTALTDNETVADDHVVYQATGTYDVTSITWSLTGADASLFEISNEEGSAGNVTFRTAEDVNHETKSSYEFTVVATSGDLTTTKDVTISVTDVNETPPEIANVDATPLRENVIYSSTDDVIYQAQGVADVGAITWGLKDGVNDAALFVIDSTTGAVRFGTSTSPNHEVKDSYTFTVTATSGPADNRQQSEREVTVNVLDLNDTDPVFDNGATHQIDNGLEDQKTYNDDDVIYTAKADADVKDNPISWSIKKDEDGNDIQDGGLFQINADGEVRFKTSTPIVYDEKNSYTFTILAKTDAVDDKDQDQTSEQVVTITVRDTNGPVSITSNGAGNAELVENTVYDTDAALYTATGTYDLYEIKWSLKEVDDYELFAIDEDSGVVTFNADATADQRTPDHEAKASYSITIIATSANEDEVGDDRQEQTAEKQVIFAVTDVNEAPTLEEVAIFALDEDVELAAGTLVYTVKGVYDTAEITWSIKDNGTDDDGGLFTIEAGKKEEDRGKLADVTLKAALTADHEVKDSYTFTILAKSGDLPAVEKTVTISVNDLNDDPVITSSETGGLEDNRTYVGTGDDVDTDNNIAYIVTGEYDNDAIVWSVKQTGDGVLFKILETSTNTESTDGVNTSEAKVVFRDERTLNAEEKGSYVITLIAQSGTKSVEHTVTLTVANTNDAPIITSGDGSDSDTLPENTIVRGGESQARDIIYTAKGEYDIHAIVWSIKDTGTDNDGNRIDDGHLVDVITTETDTDERTSKANVIFKTSETPDFETKANYTFTIVATSGAGDEQKVTEKTVTITVTDVNEGATITSAAVGGIAGVDDDNNPVIDNLVENDAVPITQMLYTATATLDVEDPANAVTWSLGGKHASLFDISNDAASIGQVTFKNQETPDYESDSTAIKDADGNITASYYEFDVIATSGGIETRKTVRINIDDRDEPVINTETTPTVTENQKYEAGAEVFTAAADVPVTWRKANTAEGGPGDDGALFNVASDGKVTFVAERNDIDYEGQSSYELRVVATSDDGISTVHTYIIEVENKNETAPDIKGPTSASPTSYRDGDVFETDDIFYQTTASYDAVAPTWRLSGVTSNLFDVTSVIDEETNTSTVTVTFKNRTTLDFETIASYPVTLHASSAGREDSKALNIILTNINDVAPVITSSDTYTFDDGTLVFATNEFFTASLTRDAASNGGTRVQWSLGGEDAGLFNITQNTGILSFKSNTVLNRSIKVEYNLILQVETQDAFGNKLQTSQNFTVAIKDISPAFTIPSGRAVFNGSQDNIPDDGLSYEDSVIYLMDGDDSGTVSGDGNIILAGNGNDEITVDGSDVTVFGMFGNDTITLDTNQGSANKAQTIVYRFDGYGKDGSDTIKNFHVGTDTIVFWDQNNNVTTFDGFASRVKNLVLTETSGWLTKVVFDIAGRNEASNKTLTFEFYQHSGNSNAHRVRITDVDAKTTTTEKLLEIFGGADFIKIGSEQVIPTGLALAPTVTFATGGETVTVKSGLVSDEAASERFSYDYSATSTTGGTASYSLLETDNSDLFMINSATGRLQAKTDSKFDYNTIPTINLKIQAKFGDDINIKDVTVTVTPNYDNALFDLFYTTVGAQSGSANDLSSTLNVDPYQVRYLGDGADNGTIRGHYNVIFGGAGDDVIRLYGHGHVVIGGSGNDTIDLNGYSQDTIVYRFDKVGSRARDGLERVTDFKAGEDRIIFVDASGKTITFDDLKTSNDIRSITLTQSNSKVASVMISVNGSAFTVEFNGNGVAWDSITKKNGTNANVDQLQKIFGGADHFVVASLDDLPYEMSFGEPELKFTSPIFELDLYKSSDSLRVADTILADFNVDKGSASGDLRYSISGEVAKYFNINSNNGKLTLKTGFDFDSAESGRLFVTATAGSESNERVVDVTFTEDVFAKPGAVWRGGGNGNDANKTKSNVIYYMKGGDDSGTWTGDNNLLFLGVGDDTITLNGANNIVSGGTGNDIINGKNGSSDTVIYRYNLDNGRGFDDNDRFNNFEVGTDKIVLVDNTNSIASLEELIASDLNFDVRVASTGDNVTRIHFRWDGDTGLNLYLRSNSYLDKNDDLKIIATGTNSIATHELYDIFGEDNFFVVKADDLPSWFEFG